MQPTIALPLDSFLAALDLNDAFASMAQDSMSVDAYIRQRIALQARTQNLIGRIGSCNASSPDDLAVRFIVDQLTYDKDVVSLVPSRLPDDEKALLSMCLSSLEDLGGNASLFERIGGESTPAIDWDGVVMHMCEKASISPIEVVSERLSRAVDSLFNLIRDTEDPLERGDMPSPTVSASISTGSFTAVPLDLINSWQTPIVWTAPAAAPPKPFVDHFQMDSQKHVPVSRSSCTPIRPSALEAPKTSRQAKRADRRRLTRVDKQSATKKASKLRKVQMQLPASCPSPAASNAGSLEPPIKDEAHTPQ